MRDKLDKSMFVLDSTGKYPAEIEKQEHIINELKKEKEKHLAKYELYLGLIEAEVYSDTELKNEGQRKAAIKAAKHNDPSASHQGSIVSAHIHSIDETQAIIDRLKREFRILSIELLLEAKGFAEILSF